MLRQPVRAVLPTYLPAACLGTYAAPSRVRTLHVAPFLASFLFLVEHVPAGCLGGGARDSIPALPVRLFYYGACGGFFFLYYYYATAVVECWSGAK